MQLSTKLGGLMIDAQERGALGQLDYAPAIFPRIVFTRIGKRYREEGPRLEILLDNRYVFNLDGEISELQSEFDKIVQATPQTLVNLSALPLSVDKWAVDPSFVWDVRSETASLGGPRSWTALMMIHPDGNKRELFLDRKVCSDRFNEQVYGGNFFRDQIVTEFKTKNWRAQSSECKVFLLMLTAAA